MPSDVEIVWLAGLLEGEGCFGVKKGTKGGSRPCLRLQLQMSDRNVVERAAHFLEGNAKTCSPRKKHPEWSIMHFVEVNGAKAERAMAWILPYMGERRTQRITESLFAENLSHHKPGWSLPEISESKQSRELDIAWLAGLLEGEGCFHVSSPTTGRPGILVYLQMRDYDVVLRAQQLMGAGKIGHRKRSLHNPKHNDTFQISVHGRKAEPVMRDVLPYMGERKAAQISGILSMEGLSHHDPRV